MACTECGGQLNGRCQTVCCSCCKKIRERGFHFLTETCDLVGQIGGVSASLKLVITDKMFVGGTLTLEGFAEVGVQGDLGDGESLELELDDSVVDESDGKHLFPVRKVPALAGVFDRRTFTGNANQALQDDVLSDFAFTVTRLIATRPTR